MLRGSVTEELVLGFDVGEGIGGRERIRAKIRSGVKIWVQVQTWTRQRLQGQLWM